MDENYKISTSNFAEYLQSVVQLNSLERMTQELDKELSDSQNIMTEIRAIYDSVCNVQNSQTATVNNGLRHEDISKFLEESMPKFLLPDMTQNNADLDIDDVIASLKIYAEDLKKNFSKHEVKVVEPKEFESLNLEQYAQSLDQLNKRMSHIKLSKKDELNNRNVELEGKLTQLCDDVNKFTTMVQAKTAISESNKNWEQRDSNALQYENIISKLLSGINEVTYLLQNKN